MSQTVFNNGDTLGVARSAINANAVDAQSRLTDLEPLNITEVRTASDLSSLVAGMEYRIHGAIVTTATTVFPAGNGRVAFTGAGPGASITSSTNGIDLFSDDSDDAGAVKFTNISVGATGVGSKVFDLTNNGTGSFVLDTVTISASTEIGTLKGYRFISFSGSQDVGCTDGWTFDGTIADIAMSTYGTFGIASGGTTFKAGGTLSITGRMGFAGIVEMQSGATFCDFTASDIVQDAGMEIVFADFSGAGDFIPNLLSSSTKARYRDNNFPATSSENNTYVGGEWTIESGDEVINSTTPTTYAKVNGTTTPTDLQWFSSGTANDITSDTTRHIEVQINGVIYFTGTNNQTIQCKIVADDGTPVDIQELGEIEFISTGAPTAYPIVGINASITSAATKIEVHAKSSSGSFTAKIHSNLTVSERAN